MTMAVTIITVENDGGHDRLVGNVRRVGITGGMASFRDGTINAVFQPGLFVS